MTVVGSDAELFPVATSPGVATAAEFVTLGTAATATLTVRVIGLLLAPAASGPAVVQVTAWPTALQLHPVPVPDTYVRPVGSVSVTVIVPVVGPDPTVFDTTIV